MRICVLKATQQLLEAQSWATAGTLIRNALARGYALEDIEERVVSDAEYALILENLPERDAIDAANAAREQAISDNLPSWQQVSDAIDAATTIAACKVILKKLARVVYWLAKGRND